MNKLPILILIFILINNCSTNKKQRFWNKEKNQNISQFQKKLFKIEKINTKEVNRDLKIQLIDKYKKNKSS